MDIHKIIGNCQNTVLCIIEIHEQSEVRKTKRNRSSRDFCLQENLCGRENKFIIDAYKGE